MVQLARQFRKGFNVFLLVAILVVPVVDRHRPTQAQESRLVLAFYYAWYDHKTWSSGKVPDTPTTPYVSADRGTIARHVDQAKGAGIDALVLNWWGKGNQTNKNLGTLLDVAAQKGLKVAIDFDINSPFMKGVGGYADNLSYLLAERANHSAYLRHHGRPVVFFYNVSRLPASTWKSIRDQVDPERKSLWIAEGVDISYLSVFDGHHLYSVTWSNNIPPANTLPKWGNRVRTYNQQHGTSKLWVATVMPGYDDRRVRPKVGFARSRDNGAYYRQCWQAAVDSQPQWVIINSFNEWPEGTYIEPSQAYGSLYLDITREWTARFKSMAGGAASPASSQAVAPTPTPVPPTPTPQPPTPTPLPSPTPILKPVPPAFVIDDLWIADQQQAGRLCGYAVVRVDTTRYWIVYCNSESILEDEPWIAH